MENQEEDLSKVKVQVATCSKCNGAVMVAVTHKMDRRATREFAKLLEGGCDVHSTNVIVARTLRWCWDERSNCEGMWPKKTKKKKSDEVDNKK